MAKDVSLETAIRNVFGDVDKDDIEEVPEYDPKDKDNYTKTGNIEEHHYDLNEQGIFGVLVSYRPLDNKAIVYLEANIDGEVDEAIANLQQMKRRMEKFGKTYDISGAELTDLESPKQYEIEVPITSQADLDKVLGTIIDIVMSEGVFLYCPPVDNPVYSALRQIVQTQFPQIKISSDLEKLHYGYYGLVIDASPLRSDPNDKFVETTVSKMQDKPQIKRLSDPLTVVADLGRIVAEFYK